MSYRIDVRSNERLVFSQDVESHRFEVADDGATATFTFCLVEALPSPDVPVQDIDEINARLAAEGVVAIESDPDADAEPQDEALPAPTTSRKRRQT